MSDLRVTYFTRRAVKLGGERIRDRLVFQIARERCNKLTNSGRGFGLIKEKERHTSHD